MHKIRPEVKENGSGISNYDPAKAKGFVRFNDEKRGRILGIELIDS